MTSLAYFERQSKDYLQRSRTGLWQFLRNAEFDAVVGLLRPAPRSTLLDLGCGAGFYALALKERYLVDVVGVDSSAGMLRNLAGAIETIESPIENLELDRKFDNVLAVGVLEFMTHPHVLFEKAKQWLNPNGQLVVMIPDAGICGWIYKIHHYFQRCPVFLRPISYYLRLAESLHLKVTAVRRCWPLSVVLVIEGDC